MRRAAAMLGVLLAACSGGDRESEGAAELPRTAADSAAADAQLLGNEITRLLDLAADFRGSHRGRAPRSLKELAVDSLTPTLARSVRGSGGNAWITVAFRDAAGRRYRSCTGDLSVLESSGIGHGDYELTCTSPDGQTGPVRVGATE